MRVPRRGGAALLLLALVVAAIAAAWLPGAQVARAAGSAAVAGTDGSADLQHFTITHDGRERSYYLWLPDNAAQARVPLVIVLHGGGGNGENAARMTGFTAQARRAQFAVAYPEGTGRFPRLLTWNAGHCCGYAMTERVDDVGFVVALITRLVQQGRVDPRRVYVTGMSNGAMMAHRIGIDAPQHVAAIAPVVGGLFVDEPPVVAARPSPVSALLINGALDRSVPVAGGHGGGRFTNAWDGTALAPAAIQLDYWAAANGCRGAVTEHVQGSVVMRTAPCPDGVTVQSLVLNDNGHAWPGGERGSSLGDTPSTALDATSVMWAFFAAHPKPVAQPKPAAQPANP